jgi:hypothetical protein
MKGSHGDDINSTGTFPPELRYRLTMSVRFDFDVGSLHKNESVLVGETTTAV